MNFATSYQSLLSLLSLRALRSSSWILPPRRGHRHLVAVVVDWWWRQRTGDGCRSWAGSSRRLGEIIQGSRKSLQARNWTTIAGFGGITDLGGAGTRWWNNCPGSKRALWSTDSKEEQGMAGTRSFGGHQFISKASSCEPHAHELILLNGAGDTIFQIKIRLPGPVMKQKG